MSSSHGEVGPTSVTVAKRKKQAGDERADTQRWFWTWVGKGLGVPVLFWIVWNLGILPGLPSLLLQMAGTTVDGSREQIRVPWKCEWQKSTDGTWKLLRVESGTTNRSRSRTALFTDISQSALRNNASFHDQLSRGNEVWRSQMDAATGMDIYGHKGVAVGDYDGDGLEDFYVCQPGGLPNRLFRNLGDGRFEDVSEKTGADVLEATSMALFADIDNNGTQDLILILAAGQPLLFLNNGHGHFQVSSQAFPGRTTQRGTMTFDHAKVTAEKVAMIPLGRLRPNSASTAWARISSAVGGNPVAATMAQLMKAGWSVTPQGGVR
jgi:hypothetical protein